MLLVNATAGVSAIHGIGLIARELIPRGTRVWEFRQGFDLILTTREVEALSPAAREQVLWYAFYDHARSTYVLSGDDDRFTNHADLLIHTLLGQSPICAFAFGDRFSGIR